MKLSNTICLIIMSLMPLLGSGQDLWESYDHSQLFNSPASVFPYQDGIMVPTLRGTLNGYDYQLSGFKALYFNYYANDGSIQRIGNIGSIQNIYDNIQYRINSDSTLSIIVFGVIDYDIPGPITEIDFDGTIATVTDWEESFEGIPQVTFFGEDRYLVVENDSTFLIDANHDHVTTVSYLQSLKVAYTNKEPILYDESAIYMISQDESLTQVNSETNIDRIRYLDEHFFVSTTSEIIKYTLDWSEVGRYQLPTDYRWDNITGNHDHTYFYFKSLDPPTQTLILESKDNSELNSITSMVDVITQTNDYQYRLKTDSSEKHMHSLVNKSPLDTLIEDYDYMQLSIEDGIVELDSQVYGGFTVLGPDTVYYDYHYYSGFVTIKNEGQDTLYNTNLHSTPIQHDYPWSHTNIYNFSVDTTIPPQEVYTHKFDFRIRSSLNMESFDLVIYGANDKRLKEPLLAQLNIVGSTDNNFSQEFEIKIYPNPATEYFRVKSDQPFTSINLYTLDGKSISSDAYSQSGRYNIGYLPKGIYFAQVLFEDGSSSISPMYVSK